ncbi:glucosamine inositolphosphorylceramide transferase family protein [Pseudoxanthomonas dokdonensis]|uniref:glucosamine inositolphosphorylceramide transferase family protein n=1 Tax=Pseudoxanthomonas dokdonensis TaxID=344882 RepID=UPI00070A67F6|nr:hypothetical protein [Pseudoxanthomonas dokdonensis]
MHALLAPSLLYPLPIGDAARLTLMVVLASPTPQWLLRFIALANGSVRLRVMTVQLPLAAIADADIDPEPALPSDVRAVLALERLAMPLLSPLLAMPPWQPMQMLKTDQVQDIERCADMATLQRMLQEFRPQLVLDATGRLAKTGYCQAVGAGCWSLAAELLRPATAGASLLAASLRGDSSVRIALQREDADGQVTLMSESWGASRPLSLLQHRDAALLKLPALLMRGIRQWLAVPPAQRGSTPQDARIRLAPTATVDAPRWGQGVRALARSAVLLLQSPRRRRRARQPWFVLVADGERPVDPERPRLQRFAALVAPGKDYWADPFPLQHHGKRLLFVEQYLDAAQRGVISCLQLDEGNRPQHLGIILDEPFHLSYPRVFRWQDEWYMTVESAEGLQVRLYRCVDFPLRWSWTANLLENRECVDPTLHYRDGYWYLFGNVSETGANPSDELFLFVSRDLAGPYLPHPCNPIVADARRARSAGGIIERDGRWFRPAQCCCPIYGSAVVFNQITTLTPTEYAEHPVGTLAADMLPDLDGCHTYNVDGDFEVVDAHGVPPAH